MIKIKTAEAIGPALDWLVAKCEEGEELAVNWHPHKWLRGGEWLMSNQPYSPSTDWSQGGPIIEREGINIFKHNKLDVSEPDKWCAHKVVPRPNMEGSINMVAIAPDGPTPLIAAMRCYVTSKLGDEVEVPRELT